ncbi:MAG: TM2 domain-containing protein [Lachnospiraceae bacterium]|nr:TM2 domain-containing protein [Lachnospiraceae bacterium]
MRLSKAWQIPKRKDPRVETGLDTEWFEETYAGRAAVYENIYLNDHVFLKLAIVSSTGLAAIIPYEEKADASIGNEVRYLLGVDASSSDIVFHADEISLKLSADGTKLIPVADIYSYFHEKLRKTEEGIRVLDEQSVTRLQGRLEALENAEPPVTDADEIIDRDGSLYVRRYSPVMLGNLDTGLAGKKQWYPVADDDTDTLVSMAAFGGWFGLHRFAQGEIAEGILYLITCGCVGILPALDIVQYLTGSMFIHRVEYMDDGELTRVRTRLFLKKPVNKAWAIACIPIAVIISMIAWKLVHQGLVPALFQVLFGAASSMQESLSADPTGILPAITDGFTMTP